MVAAATLSHRPPFLQGFWLQGSKLISHLVPDVVEGQLHFACFVFGSMLQVPLFSQNPVVHVAAESSHFEPVNPALQAH